MRRQLHDAVRASLPCSHRLPGSLPTSHTRLQHRPFASRPPRPPPPPKRKALVDVALVGAGVLSITAIALWINHRKRTEDQSPKRDLPIARGQFEIPVASSTGSGPAKKTLSMLTTAETSRILSKGQATYEVNRPGNPVYRYDTNSVASNSPSEDDSVITIVARALSSSAPTTSPQGDLLFFGVFDGHSGWQTSKILAEKLVPFVGRELEGAITGDPEYAALSLRSSLDKGDKAAVQGRLDKLWGTLTLRGNEVPRLTDLDADSGVVEEAIKRAFLKLDDEIVQAPVKLLKQLEEKGQVVGVREKAAQEMTPDETKALQTLLPALSGSCALMAYIDTARSRIHTAVTGDSRAVMGVWEAGSSPTSGKWKAHVLSEDQEGTNPKEVKRMQSEHPPNEADTVIQRGRVLGGLQPTRAFGDSRYKWPLGMQERLYAAFYPGSGRNPPPTYLTPPYVTAEPVVTTTPLPTDSPGVGPEQTQAFVVLATDGLWDRLSNEEVVGLVGAWVEGAKGTLSRKQVVSKVGEVKDAHREAHAPHNESMISGFVAEDDNACTHLIRNALGGASRDQVSALLSIPAPHSRRYRDDITVTVVLLGKGGRGPGQVEGVRKVTLPTAKL